MFKNESDTSVHFKLIKDIGDLNENSDYSVRKKVSIIKWSFNKPTIDIRRRKNNEPKKGISLSLEEAKELKSLLDDAINQFENLQTTKDIENDFSLLDDD